MMRYLFEDYALDTGRRELRRGASLVALEPKAFDLLVHLIEKRDQVVSKDNLLAAVWSGRIVSDSALTTRVNAARSAIGDSGAQQRLVKTVLRCGLRFVGAVREEAEGPAGAALLDQATPGLALQDKPSIAVLPFTNLSGDPDYFTDGIVEEIITGLSRMSWLFVIARNSSFTYKGRAVDVKQVGRELGVRYVLEGSLQKAADRVRITAQLIDAATGAHLSADRFDGRLEDIFDLQDQVTARVVGAITPRLEKAEITRARHKPTESLDAYDHYLRGLSCLYQWTKVAHSEALAYFYKAIAFDPDFATPYGLAARCYLLRMTNGWMADKQREIAETARLCRRAVERGKDDPVALSMAGWALGRVVGDIDAAVSLVDRALALNPNLAMAWLACGFVNVLLGNGDVAVERLTHAMRLSPLDSQMPMMLVGMACAHFIAGRYDEASAWAGKALAEQPSHGPAARIAAASHALAGYPEKAAQAMARLREIDPALRIADGADRFPFRRPQDTLRFIEGLRKAGVPE
jgi:TolB-like protein/Flp pilus assembly protein TadD